MSVRRHAPSVEGQAFVQSTISGSKNAFSVGESTQRFPELGPHLGFSLGRPGRREDENQTLEGSQDGETRAQRVSALFFGLSVFKAHRLLNYSTLGSIVIKKRRRRLRFDRLMSFLISSYAMNCSAPCDVSSSEGTIL